MTAESGDESREAREIRGSDEWQRSSDCSCPTLVAYRGVRRTISEPPPSKRASLSGEWERGALAGDLSEEG